MYSYSHSNTLLLCVFVFAFAFMEKRSIRIRFRILIKCIRPMPGDHTGILMYLFSSSTSGARQGLNVILQL